MQILKVDSEKCKRCGLCAKIFKGMPETAHSGIVVPLWADTCFNTSKDILIELCDYDAITVEIAE